MFEVSSPTLISTHPADTSNSSGTWLQSLGDGRFIVVLGDADNNYIETVVFSIDADGQYIFGPAQQFDPTTGGTFSFNFNNLYDESNSRLIVFPSTTNVAVFSTNGTVASLENIGTLTLSRGIEAGTLTAGAIYTPSEQSILLFATGLSFELRPQVIKINGDDTVTEYPTGGLILPEGIFIAYPSRIVGAAVGNNGDVIYCLQTQNYDPSETKMVFIRVTVTGGSTVISAQYQGVDTDGYPMAIAGDPDNQRFVVRYNDISTGEVKFVYGELSGDTGITLGLPSVYNGGVDGTGWGTGSATWQKGTDNFVSAIPYATSMDIVTSSVDNFEVTTNLDTKSSFMYQAVQSGSIVFDESLNQAVLGVFGDSGIGSFPLADRVYTLTAEGDPATIDLFWQHHTKQKEPSAGKLSKEVTSVVIPGKAGQPRVPATPGHGAYCSSTLGSEKVCKKVF